MKYSKLSINSKFLSFIKEKWYLIVLIIISILSFYFNFYAISKYGYGNEYYAAAIRSMTQNIKNFFFVSFDPNGMVSVDKPPLGLWMQAISVLIFGYHGWAMLLPQALAGTGSCIMLYILVSKYFGDPAGLISSFIFSFTPIVVAASRNNTMDMQLVFVLLIATYFLFKSIESHKNRYLFIAGTIIGIGFNIKMLEAYLVLPAFAIVYLIFAKGKLLKKVLNGIIATIIMLVISLLWVFAVDLYPSTSRPYVDSTTNNSVMELIIGHNGLERIYGRQNGKSNMKSYFSVENQLDNNYKSPNKQNDKDTNIDTPKFLPSHENSSPYQINNKSQGGGDEIGASSILRFWNNNLYGQISWLLIFSICSIITCFPKFNGHEFTLKESSLTFWILWLVTMFIFFSFAGFFHRYYLCMVAPAIAALCGIGTIEMYKEFSKKSSWKQFMLPFSLISTFAIEIIYILNYAELKTWLLPIMIAIAILSILFIIISYFKPSKLINYLVISFTLISILIAPFYWALTPIMYVPNSTMPYAGPELASQPGNNFSMNHSESTNNTLSALQEYLVKNYKEGSFLVVSERSNDVAQFIINTGLPAYAYGGFLGTDNSLTPYLLKKYVSEGKITYFLISDRLSNDKQDSELISYVKKNATLIDPIEYGNISILDNTTNTRENNNTSYSKNTRLFGVNSSLYKFN